MADYPRESVLAGEAVRLRAVLRDKVGNYITPDALPTVYIYDDSVDSDIMQSEIDAGTFTSAISGPITATLVSTGFYYIDYTVPAGSANGLWYDIWVATINTTVYRKELLFSVEEDIDITDQDISTNMMLLFKLSDEILSLDGNALVATQIYYTTTYDPFYASPDQVRSQVGPWINYLTDEAIALLIHWSSKEADFIKKSVSKKINDYKFARTMFVIYDTALKVLNQPGAGLEAGFASGRKKQLGDLSISDGTPNVTISDSIYTYILKERNEWWRVVNAGGNIVPGQSFDIASGVKGDLHPDAFGHGRLWFDPNEYEYEENAANGKARGNGRLDRFTYKNRNF